MSVCAEWRHSRKKSGTAGILPVSLNFETDSMRVFKGSSEDGLFLFFEKYQQNARKTAKK